EKRPGVLALEVARTGELPDTDVAERYHLVCQIAGGRRPTQRGVRRQQGVALAGRIQHRLAILHRDRKRLVHVDRDAGLEERNRVLRVQVAMAMDDEDRVDLADHVLRPLDDLRDLTETGHFLRSLRVWAADRDDAAVSGAAFDIRQLGIGDGVRVVRSNNSDPGHACAPWTSNRPVVFMRFTTVARSSSSGVHSRGTVMISRASLATQCEMRCGSFSSCGRWMVTIS